MQAVGFAVAAGRDLTFDRRKSWYIIGWDMAVGVTLSGP
jgi:hypothetical protein